MNGGTKHVRMQSAQHFQDAPSTGISGSGRMLVSLLVALQLLLLAVPAVSAAFTAYVTNIDSNTVSVIDTATNAVVRGRVAVGEMPLGIAVTPNGSRAYVTNFNSNTVSVIDTAAKVVVDTVAVGVRPVSVAIAPDGSRVYVTSFIDFFATEPGTVTVIDTATNDVVGDPIKVGVRPVGVAITPDGTRAYVTNYVQEDPGTVSVINTATNKVEKSIVAGGRPFGIAITPDGARAYVTTYGSDGSENSNTVTVIDIATNEVVGDPIGTEWDWLPSNVAITPDGARAYVTNSWELSDTVAVIDTATNKMMGAPIELGIRPWDIALTPDGARAYVTNDHSNKVLAIDTVTNKVVGSIDTERRNWGIATAPDLPPTSTSSQKHKTAATDAVCVSSLQQPLVSVSHWKRMKGGLRLRLMSPTGSYLLRPNRKARFTLQVRGVGGKKGTTLGKVRFKLDGKTAKTDRKRPYTLSLDPKALSNGYHKLSAVAYSKRSVKRALSLDFTSTSCEGAAFSVGMSSKIKRAHPDILLRVRSGGEKLRTVRFTLSRNLTYRTKGLARKRVGTIELTDGSGRKTVKSLKMGRRNKREVSTLTKKGSKLKVNMKLRQSPTISIKGLESFGATKVRVELFGKKTRMTRNPDSCSRHHSFRASFTTVGSNSKGTTYLERSLRMCKT